MDTTISKDYPGSKKPEALKPGTKAPDFSLHTTPDQCVALSELRGRPVTLAFYPADWSPVCSDELVLFNECLPEFQKHNAELLGISVDGVWSHMAFAKHRKLKFPLLSDFEPKGKVAQMFNAYRKMEGVCDRAVFVIDADGIIRWSYVSPIGISPGVDGILDALEALPRHQEQPEQQPQHEEAKV